MKLKLTLTLLFLLFLETTAFAQYSDHGIVQVTGTVTSVQNQQECDQYACQIGSQWVATIQFWAPGWNAPSSNFDIYTVLVNCMGGPPCFTGYSATSNFGWAPWGFDTLHLKVQNGVVVDVGIYAGGYWAEWGQDATWSLTGAFSGITTAQIYAVYGTVKSQVR